MIKQNGKDIIPRLNGKNLSRVMRNGKVIWQEVTKTMKYSLNMTGVASNQVILRDANFSQTLVDALFNKFFLMDIVGNGATYGTPYVRGYKVNNTNKAYRTNGDMCSGDIMLFTPALNINITDGSIVDITEDINGNYPSCLIGAFPGVIFSNQFHSYGGFAPTVGKTKTELSTYATARGNGFQLCDSSMYYLIRYLYMLKYTDTNVENTIGAGKVNSMSELTGVNNELGMTDTTAGTGFVNNFLGLEAIAGGMPEFSDDFYYSGSAFNRRIPTKYNKGVEITLNIPTNIGARIKSYSNVNDFIPDKFYNAGTDRNNGFSSFFYTSTLAANYYALFGGNFNGVATDDSYDSGMFYTSFNNNANTLYYKGGRLGFRGKIILINDDGTETELN